MAIVCLSASHFSLSFSPYIFLAGSVIVDLAPLSLSPYVFLVGSAFAGPVSPSDTDRADHAGHSWASSESLTSCR